MAIFLLDHFAGCMPLQPCISCRAAEFLRGKLSPEDYESLVEMAKESESGEPDRGPVTLMSSIKRLEVSSYTKQVLESNGVETIADVAKLTAQEFLRIPHTGRRVLTEIRAALKLLGFEHNLGK